MLDVEVKRLKSDHLTRSNNPTPPVLIALDVAVHEDRFQATFCLALPARVRDGGGRVAGSDADDEQVGGRQGPVMKTILQSIN